MLGEDYVFYDPKDFYLTFRDGPAKLGDRVLGYSAAVAYSGACLGCGQALVMELARFRLPHEALLYRGYIEMMVRVEQLPLLGGEITRTVGWLRMIARSHRLQPIMVVQGVDCLPCVPIVSANIGVPLIPCFRVV